MRIAYALPLLLLATGAVAKTPAPPPESSAKLTAAKRPKCRRAILSVSRQSISSSCCRRRPRPIRRATSRTARPMPRARWASTARHGRRHRRSCHRPMRSSSGRWRARWGSSCRAKRRRRRWACCSGRSPDFVPPMNVAKDKYMRARPFTTDDGPACDPLVAKGQGAKLGPSYPSGHSGIGWLIALALGDAAPAKATALRTWGADVGPAPHRLPRTLDERRRRRQDSCGGGV